MCRGGWRGGDQQRRRRIDEIDKVAVGGHRQRAVAWEPPWSRWRRGAAKEACESGGEDGLRCLRQGQLYNSDGGYLHPPFVFLLPYCYFIPALITSLEHLLDPSFFNCTDADIVLASGGDDAVVGVHRCNADVVLAAGGDDAIVGVHRCIVSARSNFFLDHFSSLAADPAAGEKPLLVLAELLPGGRHIGHDAIVPVLGYLYTGLLKAPPQGTVVCVDDRCSHEACRPAIDFVVESTYAASGFKISELVSLFQHCLSDFVNIALVPASRPAQPVYSTGCRLER